MKIKVLQIVGNLRIGGAETVAMNLYRYIDREKFEFHYLVYGNEIGDYEKEVWELGGKIIHINYIPKNMLTYTKILRKVVNENGPYQIIHSHMMYHNGIVLKSARKLGIPVRISHAHSTNDGSSTENFIKLCLRYIYLKIARAWIKNNATKYISCGEKAGEALYGKSFFEKKGLLLKNGIDLQKYVFNNSMRRALRTQYGLDNKRVYACIGHFQPVKNHVFLIHIFNEICKVDKTAILVLLGDGTLKEKIEILVKEKNLSDKVIFMGNVNNVSEWLQAIDFLLMPSLYEGVPLTLIEAQAAGLKCFVSDTVSKETDITDTLKFLSLKIPEQWVEITKENSNYIRENDITQLVDAGYNAKTNIQIMQSVYYESLERIE